MSTRDGITDIHSIKARQTTRSIPGQARQLREQWTKQRRTNFCTTPYFPIHATTLLEVFTRTWAARLINAGEPYLTRATSLTKDLRFDYDIVRAMHGKTISLGDLIAHNIKLNQFGQVLNTFDALLGTSFYDAIGRATGEETEPIINDPQVVRKQLTELFVTRHVLVHELPEDDRTTPTQIDNFLAATVQFLRAGDSALKVHLLGPPTTQEEDNVRAEAEQAHAAQDLDTASRKLRRQTRKRSNTRLQEQADKHWNAFIAAETRWLTDRYTGTAGPEVTAKTLTILLQARSTALQRNTYDED